MGSASCDVAGLSPGPTLAERGCVARPVLTLVRNSHENSAGPSPFDELLLLRIEVARVVLPAGGSIEDSSREALSSLCRRANHFIRQVDAGGDELSADVCFAARVRIAEATRAALTATDDAGLREARRTLYGALALLVELVSSNGTSSDGGASRRRALAPLAELIATTQAASRAGSPDAGWVLDVAAVEGPLCATRPEFSSVNSWVARRLASLQGDIARWNARGRSEGLGRELAETVFEVLELRVESPTAAVL